MRLQEKILNEYQNIYGGPSIKAISIDTGIQMTRVFRLLRGHEMKLNEYEIFKKKIEQKEKKKGQKTKLQEMILEIQEKFPEKQILELETILERFLKLFSLLQRGGNK